MGKTPAAAGLVGEETAVGWMCGVWGRWERKWRRPRKEPRRKKAAKRGSGRREKKRKGCG
jgi:hypothetical protein